MKTLDLHGYRSDEVIDTLDAFIHKQANSGAAKAKVMPGKGSGIVKKEVISYLKLAGYPWQYEKLKNGKPNEGVLIVFLN